MHRGIAQLECPHELSHTLRRRAQGTRCTGDLVDAVALLLARRGYLMHCACEALSAEREDVEALGHVDYQPSRIRNSAFNCTAPFFGVNYTLLDLKE